MSASAFTGDTLRGVILSDDDDKVVVQASPQEVRRFVARPGRDVTVARQIRGRMVLGETTWSTSVDEPLSVTQRWHNSASTGDDFPEPGVIRLMRGGVAFLHDEHGRPVATITDINLSAHPIDVTSFASRRDVFVNGITEIEIRARGLPGVRVE